MIGGISGDADFFPNGLQPLPPGCLSISCAHQRAPEFYAESVYPGQEFVSDFILYSTHYKFKFKTIVFSLLIHCRILWA